MAEGGRGDRDRDSGLGLGHDEADPLVPAVPIPEEEEGDDLENPDHQPVAPQLPPPPPPLQPQPQPPAQPQPAPAAPMAQGAQGGQLASLATYDGTKDIDVWVEQVDHAMRAFAWTSPVTSDAAKTKLSGEAAVWVASQRRLGNQYVNWNDGDADTQLRKALQTRFKPTVTALEATDAIADLKQKDTESVSAFFDRVVWAVDIKNSLTWTDAEKLQANYMPVRDGDIKAFFMAGVKREIKELVVGGGDPPGTSSPGQKLWKQA